MPGSASFFGPISAELQSHLARAALLLLTRGLPPDHPWQSQALEDFAWFAGDVPLSETVNADLLDAAFKELLGNLRQAPEAAMIAQRVKLDEHRMTANTLSAWILAAALQRRRQYAQDSVIATGLDAMRKLKARAPEALPLLEPLPHEVAGLLDRLPMAADAPNLPQRVRTYFIQIAALIKAAETGRPQIIREQENGDGSTLPLRAVEGPGGVDYLHGGRDRQSARVSGPTGLQLADQVPGAYLPLAADNGDNLAPKSVASKQLTRAAKAAARRNLALTAEHDPLTPYEVQQLVSTCKDKVEEPAHGYLLALLSFGAALSSSPGETIVSDTDNAPQPGLRLSVDLPDLGSLIAEEGEVEQKTAPPENLLVLAPPEGLDLHRICDCSSRDAIKKILDELRPSLARPLSLGRIRRFKQDWLRRVGADPAVIGFLTGMAPTARAQMHYTSLPISGLQDWHTRYLREALGCEPARHPPMPGQYGSRLDLPKDLLRLIFAEYRKDLRRIRRSPVGSLTQIARAHNAYLGYGLMLLAFATGHRPVDQPFEYFGDMDLDRGLLWISDKTGRAGRGTRVVPLCPTALQQLRFWCGHLENLAQRLSILRPELVRDHISPALDPAGEHPLFFLLSEDAEIIPLTARRQRQAMEQVLPTALNWNRHLLRSALADCGSGEVIDALLGHAHLGEEAFASGSGLALRDLRELSHRIEELLTGHRAKSVASPL